MIRKTEQFLGYPDLTPSAGITRNAIISDDGEYRYLLERVGVTTDGNPRTLLAIGVNPSTASATEDDPTVRRLYGFCRTLGYGNLMVGNKFARRSPNVKILRNAGDPIGPDNDSYLESAMKRADLVLACWGPLAKLPEALRTRWKTVVKIADACKQPLYCLGVASDGHPRHPLMLPGDSTLELWPVPWFVGRKGAQIAVLTPAGAAALEAARVPAPGIFATMSADQRAAALAYRGDETCGPNEIIPIDRQTAKARTLAYTYGNGDGK